MSDLDHGPLFCLFLSYSFVGGSGVFTELVLRMKMAMMKTHVSAGNFVKKTGCSKHSIHVNIFIVRIYEVCFFDEGCVTDKISWLNRLSSIAKLIIVNVLAM